MRCEKNDRAGPSPFPIPKMEGQRGFRSGSGHDTIATCSRSFQLSVKVRAFGVRKPPANFFECPEPGVVIVPGVHCAPIVIGYQRYFCLNCRTFGRSLISNGGPHGWWVALALRAIEQRGYRAWLKASHPIPSSATAPATV
ncbi:Uncharacterized protein DBV15_07161 [Temnothorax longispinosus]|uniref:Uncharacterized protein n=1 Tax=Temnothorax longispinosus TaxID=300112 RepID=A0A4S2KJZ5_9HYME|nr:Uncharacterized protein DBV15_07161 [Temnothorax longispinosus]